MKPTCRNYIEHFTATRPLERQVFKLCTWVLIYGTDVVHPNLNPIVTTVSPLDQLPMAHNLLMHCYAKLPIVTCWSCFKPFVLIILHPAMMVLTTRVNNLYWYRLRREWCLINVAYEWGGLVSYWLNSYGYPTETLSLIHRRWLVTSTVKSWPDGSR